MLIDWPEQFFPVDSPESPTKHFRTCRWATTIPPDMLHIPAHPERRCRSTVLADSGKMNVSEE